MRRINPRSPAVPDQYLDRIGDVLLDHNLSQYNFKAPSSNFPPEIVKQVESKDLAALLEISCVILE